MNENDVQRFREAMARVGHADLAEEVLAAHRPAPSTTALQEQGAQALADLTLALEALERPENKLAASLVEPRTYATTAEARAAIEASQAKAGAIEIERLRALLAMHGITGVVEAHERGRRDVVHEAMVARRTREIEASSEAEARATVRGITNTGTDTFAAFVESQGAKS